MQLIFPLLAAAAALGLLLISRYMLARKRLIENVPTSKCAGVCIGLTEVKGEAIPRVHGQGYLCGKDVVYYRFTVDEHWEKTETERDKDGKTTTRKTSGWTTVRSGEWRPAFEVRDETGSIRVEPEKAKMDAAVVFDRSCSPGDPLYYAKGPRGSISNSTHDRHFREWAIMPRQPLYVLGTARLADARVEPEITHDPHGAVFLISVKDESQLTRGYGVAAFFSGLAAVLLAGLAPAIAGMALRGMPFGVAVQQNMAWMILAGAAVFAIIVGLYLLLIYNGLVEVRHRARRAWSMIDVELKRRADLIPRLVQVVQAMADHERQTLTRVAQMRCEANIGALPSAQGAAEADAAMQQQTQAFTQLFALVEQYPSLKSDELFRSLNAELVRTEDRLALARNFYNESVNVLNDRVESLPDALFASLAKTTRGLHFAAVEFERKPVVVKLDDEPAEPADTGVMHDDEAALSGDAGDAGDAEAVKS